MEFPDGAWRIEVIQHGTKVTDRLIHDDRVNHDVVIGALQRPLAEAGVDWADLVDVTDRLAANTTPTA